MMVKGGMSLGADGSVSENGLTFLGSDTENSILHHEAWRIIQCFSDGRTKQSRLADFVLKVASLISSQQGPIIFRFKTSSSKGVVFVPKTWLNVGPVEFIEISGSIRVVRTVRLLFDHHEQRTIEAVDDFHPFAFAFLYRLVFKSILPSDKLGSPFLYPGLLPQLVEVLVHIRFCHLNVGLYIAS